MPARVLEIGHFHFHKTVSPQTTTLIWTGLKPADVPENDRRASFATLIWMLRALRGDAFDLAIVYVEQWSPWHWKQARRIVGRHPLRTIWKLALIQAIRLVRPRIPVMVVDLTEWGFVHRHNEFLLRKCTVWFKRELPADRWRIFRRSSSGGYPASRFRRNPQNRRRLEKVVPLSIGCTPKPANLAVSEFPDKTSDVFVAVAALDNSTIRSEGLRQIEALRDAGLRVDIAKDRIDHDAFVKRMAQAWLTWSPHGYGWDCFRHYEAPLAFSVPVMPQPSIIRQFPLLDDAHAFYYEPDDPRSLGRVIRRALADKDHLRGVAEASRTLVRDHHLWPQKIERLARMARGQEPLEGALQLDPPG